MEYSGVKELSETECYIAVWPNGLQNSWNIGPCCEYAALNNIDDTGFIVNMVAKLVGIYAIDENRVYATGLSNGGGMTHRLGFEAGDTFAAIAPYVMPALVTHSENHIPISVIAFQTTDDESVPLDGFLGVSGEDSFEEWKVANGCDGEPAIMESGYDDVQCRVYANCDDGVETAYCIAPGDHIIVDNVPGFNFAQFAWEFMSRFSLN